jgi:hypothetical protein
MAGVIVVVSRSTALLALHCGPGRRRASHRSVGSADLKFIAKEAEEANRHPFEEHHSAYSIGEAAMFQCSTLLFKSPSWRLGYSLFCKKSPRGPDLPTAAVEHPVQPQDPSYGWEGSFA